jgi:hypothetical protein
MKKISFFSILTIILISIGGVLMIGGNHLGDYITVAGAITGLYTCYLIDIQESRKPENQL